MRKKTYGFLFALALLLSYSSYSQNNQSGDVNADGYLLHVNADHLNLLSEEVMEYTVGFHFPANPAINTSSFRINFNFDPRLIKTRIDYSSVYGATSAAGGFSAHVDSSQASLGLITFSINNINASAQADIAGEFKVFVKMPADKACKDTMVRAHATLHYLTTTLPDVEKTITTNTPNRWVTTKIAINNPWIIYKANTSAKYNGLNGTCRPDHQQYAFDKTYAVYYFVLRLANQNNVGSQNLTVTDFKDLPIQLPANANPSNISFSINPVQTPGVPNTTGLGIVSSGTDAGTITYNGTKISATDPLVLDAVNNQVYILTYRITLPSNVGTGCLKNTIYLRGKDPCDHYLDTIKPREVSIIERVDSLPESLWVSKEFGLRGNLRGCTGTYYIKIRNNNDNVMNYNFYDTFPPCLTNVAFDPLQSNVSTYSPSCSTIVVNGHNTQVCHMAGTIPAGGYFYYVYNFVIGPDCNEVVTNNLYQYRLPAKPDTLVAHATFHLMPDTVLPCFVKKICGVPGDSSGQYIRFRLQIQNFGSKPLTGYKIIDDLGAIGLEYVPGSDRYYYTVRRSLVGDSCTAPNLPYYALPWTGVTQSMTGSVLNYTFTTLAPECDPNSAYEFYLNGDCHGKPGLNLPAFYIEFLAKITDETGIGSNVNIARFTDGLGGHVTLDSVPFTIRGTLNFDINKEVSTDNRNWSTTINAHPGQTIYYRLNGHNSGMPLQQPFVVDMLPMNGGVDDDRGTHANDRYLLTAGERGSNCNVYFGQQISSLLPNPDLQYKSQSDIDSKRDFGNSAIPGTNNPLWTHIYTAPMPPLTQNIKVQHYSNAFTSAQAYQYVFSAIVDSNAIKGQTACNTFGMRGYKKAMVDHQPQLQDEVPLESYKVCVNIVEDTVPCCHVDSLIVPRSVCVNLQTQYCAVASCDSGIAFSWYFDAGRYPIPGKCVTHAFTTVGRHTVRVVWTDCDGPHEREFDIDVRDCGECIIKPSFTYNLHCPVVDFDALSTYSNQQAVTYVWNFGDNTFDTGRVVHHSYTTSGHYIVTLTVYSVNDRDEACQCRERIQQEVVVDCERCELSPVINYNIHCPFVDFDGLGTTSTHPVAMYVWDFGDGTYGTGPSFPYHYYIPGTYTVTLKVYTLNENGEVCECKEQTQVRFDVERCGQPEEEFPKSHSTLISVRSTGRKPQAGNDSPDISLTATPNPFNQSLKVTVKAKGNEKREAKPYTLSLLSANGSTIGSKSIADNSTVEWSTATYSAGVYLLTLKGTDGTVKTVQVVKVNQ